ncbi:MAG: hypothetical protein MJZ16_01490 [Bacteroidales bacterium]|nr:hypothetical protein [Bacteroidales bacterium]
MYKYLTTIALTLLMGTLLSAQNVPITFSKNQAVVKTPGITYKYTDVKVIPIPGREGEVSSEDLRKYDRFAQMMRDSLLFGNDDRDLETNILDAIAEARQDGSLNRVPSGQSSFDVTKVQWKEQFTGVDYHIGVSSEVPFGFLSGYSGPAFGLTTDFGLYFQKAFIKPSIGFGVAKANMKKQMQGSMSNGKLVPNFNLSLSAGYMVLDKSKVSLSPFAGFGMAYWDYRVLRTGTIRITGLAAIEGMEMSFHPRRLINYGQNNPHMKYPSYRFRIYASQIVKSNATEILPSVNVSLCVGVYSRGIKK